MNQPALRNSVLGRRALCAAALLLALAVRAGAKESGLLTLTADHFKATASVTPDPGAGTVTVSTQPGFVERSGPLRMVWNDEYLTGVIDRKTGLTSFRVVVFVIYSGRLRSYDSAQYLAPSGVQTVDTTHQLRQVENCAVGECTYTERVAFPVDEETLRRCVADAGTPGLWHYSLLAKSGPAFKGVVSNAEIAGFLAKVDETARAAPPIPLEVAATPAPPPISVPAAPIPAPPAAAAVHDLGIDGIAVAAGEQQPNRAGVLIAAVKNGSAAQRAGVIVGDIIYEFDGQPTLSVAALQAALLAADAAKATIAFKLYRGTNSMTLTARF